MKNNLMVDEEPIRHRHIRYLEIAGKKVAVHLDDGDEVYLNGKLDDIAQLLPNEGIDRFVRCHQSYLVNLRHVESMQRYLLTFTDGEELPVSKAYTKAMQQAFTEYEN
jgi:DNA-binding LytR/AlgR family response regulator